MSLKKQFEPRYVVEGSFVAVFVFSALVAVAQAKTNALILTLAIYGMAAARAMPGLSRILTAFNVLKQGEPTLNMLVQAMDQRDHCLALDQGDSPQNKVNDMKQEVDVLQADHVSFSYQQSKAQILNNLSFSAHRGQMIGIMGKSGVGKSTLMRVIS